MAERRAQDDRNRERRGDPAPVDELDESLEEPQEAAPDEAPDVHARWWQDEAPIVETGSISNRIRVRRQGDEPLQPDESAGRARTEDTTPGNELDPAKYSSAGS